MEKAQKLAAVSLSFSTHHNKLNFEECVTGMFDIRKRWYFISICIV